jgi:hypothetical protein
MTDITIRYVGESDVEPTNRARVTEIVDALLSVFQDPAVSFDGGQLLESDEMLQFRFTLTKQSHPGDVQSDIDALTQQLVDLGVEPDTETAETNIAV